MGVLGRAWRGEATLREVALIWSLGGIAFAIIGGVIIKNGWGSNSFSIFYVVQSIAGIWVVVALWRCTFNTRWKHQRYIARALTALSAASHLLGILLLIILINVFGDTVIAGFECKGEFRKIAREKGIRVHRYIEQNRDSFEECVQSKMNNKPATTNLSP